jgi:predicted AAA+ superfamily ATPase
MPHFRERFAAQFIEKLSKLWPVVGVVGVRQSGKTTLMQKLFNINHVVTFDELAIREEALKSPKTFLGKLTLPIVLDEVQKAPTIFDAIKVKVDQKRIPGSYFLTGSSSFSSKIGIRESLTGRIGLVELFPMSLAEMHDEKFRPIEQLHHPLKSHELTPRFTFTELARAMTIGGMPVPAFLRDHHQRDLYWRSWLETTILRDLARYFSRGFDPDFAFSLLEKMASVLREGELPTLKHFQGPVRKIRSYLSAMEEIFLLRKINCHALGIGKEIWLLMDSGLAAYLMGTTLGEGVTLSLVRHFVWNEIHLQAEYQGKRFSRMYYKSAQGSPVDFVIENIPFRIVPNTSSLTQQLSWEERPLHGAMKKLGAEVGYLIGPTDKAHIPSKKGEVGILPWTAWS